MICNFKQNLYQRKRKKNSKEKNFNIYKLISNFSSIFLKIPSDIFSILKQNSLLLLRKGKKKNKMKRNEVNWIWKKKKKKKKKYIKKKKKNKNKKK